MQPVCAGCVDLLLAFAVCSAVESWGATTRRQAVHSAMLSVLKLTFLEPDVGAVCIPSCCAEALCASVLCRVRSDSAHAALQPAVC
jgi:hypothetical protein